MPQPVSTVRSTAKTRVVLALSLTGWVILCTWVWMMLGDSDRAVAEIAGVDLAEMSAMDATPGPDDESIGNVDEPTALPEPEAISDLPAKEQGLPFDPVELETASAGTIPPSTSAQSAASSRTPLDEITALLEGFPDPEGLGEAEGNDVVIPLAREPTETASERQRREELSVLTGLSSRLRFEAGSAERTPRVQTVLDRIFDPLFLYADTSIEITVNSNDVASPADNRQLSRLRGRVIVDYLAQRGLDTARFVVVSEGGRGLAIGTHRVQVISEVLP